MDIIHGDGAILRNNEIRLAEKKEYHLGVVPDMYLHVIKSMYFLDVIDLLR